MGIDSGIKGLDQLVELPSNYVMLLGGPPGTGKTAFALDYLFEGIENGESGLFISLRFSEEEVKQSVQSRGYDPESENFIILEATDLMRGDSGQVFEPEKVTEGLRRNMNDFEPERVVMDSITKFLMIFDAEPIQRERASRLVDLIDMYDSSALFIGEVPFSKNGQPSRYEIMEFVADGIFRLQHKDETTVFDILKMRGLGYDQKQMQLNIDDEEVNLSSLQESP